LALREEKPGVGPITQHQVSLSLLSKIVLKIWTSFPLLHLTPDRDCHELKSGHFAKLVWLKSLFPHQLNSLGEKCLSIRDDFDPDSNMTEEGNFHCEKHLSPKNSTDAGIMISTKQVPRNASFSIRDNLDHDSNVTEESDLHQ
jgi:hypothetical protein